MSASPNRIKDAFLPMQVRAARAMLNWSQDQLSAASGVPKRTLAGFEVAENAPRAATMEAIRTAWSCWRRVHRQQRRRPWRAAATMSKPVADDGAYHPEERKHSQLRLMRYWRNALTRGIKVLKQTQPQALAGVIRFCTVFIAEDQRLDFSPDWHHSATIVGAFLAG
jgi:hypothetical protein